ncbi:MAG TPA: hypothetical protein PLO89_01735 [Spirochaetota bacterium]|nr:hypothetical protein [Spirochaetota bacterium]
MKKILLSIYFLVFFINIFNSLDNEVSSERLYCFKIFSFGRRYEIYFTKIKKGYYRYEINFNDKSFFLTYEGKEFYNQCLFDENNKIDENFYPMNLWTNDRGEVLKFEKRYSPVIDKNRKMKNYPYGFGKN